MPQSAEPESLPVTADDLDLAVQLAVTTLRDAPPAAWDGKAGSLAWDCWENGDVPFVCESRRPGGPAIAVHADPAAGPAGLLQVLEVSGALLVAMVRTTSSRVRAYHSDGVSDPEGFAAMGIVETLVHTDDLAEGLGLAWAPPADLCSRALARLFPDAPRTTDPWPTLLWATGRAELPGHPRLTTWRWYGTPQRSLRR
jgi:hypothetical protein